MDSGIIPDSDLVVADNIIFSTSGSRKKREGFTYLDTSIPAPQLRSSSGTTRTLKWTTASIQVAVGTTNNIVVDGEKLSFDSSQSSGNEPSYEATGVAVTLANQAEVSTVTTVADSAGSLNNKYFYLSAAENATLYYVWINVNSAGSDPAISGRTGVQVAVATGASANTVASAIQVAVDALADFTASVVANAVTITNAATGIATDLTDAGSTGFTLAVTTQGGHTLVYTATGSLNESSTATTTLSLTKSSDILNLIDYWRLDGSSVKQQLIMAATDQFKLFRYSSAGARQEVTGTGGPASATTRILSKVLNDKCIFSFNAVADKAIKYDPDSASTYAALGGTPPDFFVMESYLGRLWTNDKTAPDRLHYSSTGNPEEWNGAGDSGAIDIAIGDGDSVGISAIFVYKNLLYVAKRDLLFRITGNTPETFKIEDVSKGLGIESPAGVCYVDDTDVLFPSVRGIHAASASVAYGDVESTFLSKKIQPTYEGIASGRLKFIQSVYVPELNSAAFTVSEGASTQNALYFYNVIEEEWYRWPNISCTAIAVRRNSDQKQLIIGTDASRILTTQNGTFVDYTTTGITYRIKSGAIYPGGNPQTWKGFKRLSLFFKPLGRTNFTCTVKIDNQAEQSFNFVSSSGTHLLGSTFILGTSLLGTSDAFAPFSMDLTGYGRGMTIEINQSGLSEQVEIYGYSIEYEDADIVPEVISA